jgi:hypothetical protein
MKINKIKNRLILVSISIVVAFSSCQKTTEQQVEKMLKTENSKSRKKQATKLAFKVDTTAVTLVKGLSQNTNDLSVMNDTYISIIEGYREHNDCENPFYQSYMTPEQATLLFECMYIIDNNILDKLISKLEQSNYQDFFAKIGDKAFQTLQKRMMNSSDERIWNNAAATIFKMSEYYPDVTKYLFDAIESQNTIIIAKNYRFYIKAGIKGSEEIMIKALDNHFDYNMCMDYINCGYGYLENQACSVANRHDYQCNRSFGNHYGPRWGEGN